MSKKVPKELDHTRGTKIRKKGRENEGLCGRRNDLVYNMSLEIMIELSLPIKAF
jgi:hypothetical protein